MSAGSDLQCRGCGRHYPVLSGIPLLVREPAGYVRSERAALVRAAGEARQRRSLLDRTEPGTRLPDATLVRHRDVLDAAAAQAEILLALLGPPATSGGAPADGGSDMQAVRPGWDFATLAPYLLRDWTNTAELQLTGARIGAVLERAFPDPRGRSIAFAGCGAGGLLARIASDFGRVLGFDLALPILAAARRLLDGETIVLPLPHILNETGCVMLRGRQLQSTTPRVELAAMDALDTAVVDRAIDCVVTVFLTDILPDPRALADEINRMLAEDGIWINYGPSGNNLEASWRFDQTEAPVFFRTAGFTVIEADAQRSTNLDISNVCPSISFRNAMCYLTVARKSGAAGPRPSAPPPEPVGLRHVVPRHFPGARLLHRLEGAEDAGIAFQHDRNPARAESWELGGRAARIVALVDGRRTAGEIADLLNRRQPSLPFGDTLRAFERFFRQGLLDWQGR